MRIRAALALGLVLVLGVTTAVALAWIRAALIYPSLGDNSLIDGTGYDEGEHAGVRVVEFRSTGATARLLGGWTYERWGHTPDEVDVPAWSMARRGPPAGPGEYPVAAEKEFGWPVRCMRVRWRFNDESIAYAGETLSGGVLIESVRWGMLPSSVIGQPNIDFVEVESYRAIPLVPVWQGLLINGLLFSAPWGLLLAMLVLPGAIRRRSRRRRARCVRCGYPAPQNSVECPECGLERGARAPIIGAWSLAVLSAVTLVSVGATIGFAVWRSQSVERMPAVHLAAAKGDHAAITRLVANGADPDLPLGYDVPTPGYRLNDARPLAWAAARGHVEAVRALLDAGASVDSDEGAALKRAAEHGHAHVCRVLIDAGADPKLAGHYEELPLAIATRGGDAETIAVIRDAIGEFSHDPQVLRAAIPNGADAVIDVLRSGDWEQGALQEALRDAAHWGTPAVARALLEHGTDAAGASAPLLWHAAERGNAELIELLLAYGAPVDKEHPVAVGWSPLRRTVVRDCPECFWLIFAEGGDPDVVDDEGDGLLHVAARTGVQREFFEQLVDIRLPIDLQNRHGTTPLMAAVVSHEVHAASYLLDAGADPTIRDRASHSALDYARGGIDHINGFARFSTTPAPAEIVEMLEAAETAWAKPPK